jgi:hypothetical protein
MTQSKAIIARVGVGAPTEAGVGAVNDLGPLDAGVYAMLQAGSPRLALAKALGVPLAPYIINVRAIFPDTTTDVIPDVGSDVKIVQDTLIDALVCRVQNESLTANQNQWQAESDYYYGFQSGIEAKIDVVGAPRYSVAPKFTPLSTLCDMVNGASHWPGGWILTYQQQLMMNFNARVLLPYAPIEVICTYRGWVPTNEMFVSMTNREAIDRLNTDCGITLTDVYVNRLLSR